MLQKKRKLSVIIPVYNSAEFIEECIASIFEQNIKTEDFEIVIVDDGSTDNSLKLCRDLAHKHANMNVISIINQGVSVARNIGLHYSVGKYIYFIDSDDYLTPNYLSELLELMVSKDHDFIGFSYKRTEVRKSNNGSINSQLNVIMEGSGLEIISNFNFNNGSCWYIFEKTIVNDLKFVEGRLCEDGLFTAELLQNVKRGLILSNEIYNYYINPNSTVKTEDITRRRKMIDDMLFAVQAFNAIIDKIDISNMKAFYRLRERQESYSFFAYVRMLKLGSSYNEFKNAIQISNSGKNKCYPIKVFDGYGSMQNKLLIYVFNHKLFLRAVIFFNSKLKFIK